MTSFSEPVFLEFAGLPASGKTTTASILKNRLSQLGLLCTVVPEAAARSPLQYLKRNWTFNAWTLCQAVGSVLEHSSGNKRHDVVVLDRGLVDALCWINWFRSRNQIDLAVAKALESFAQVPTWFDNAALTVVLRVQFETALHRRGMPGRILNPTTFEQLRQAYDETIGELLNRKPAGSVLVLDSDHRTPDQVLDAVTDLLVESRPELRPLIQLPGKKS